MFVFTLFMFRVAFVFILQAKQTPLHLAAQYGQLKVCETLLNMKGDAYATDIVSIQSNDLHINIVRHA